MGDPAIRMVPGRPEEQEPEAQPPATPPPPPQEMQKDIGGLERGPTPEQLAEGAGGSLADQMRARYEHIASTKEFAIPGWDLPDGTPGLILVARAFGDRSKFNEGLSNEAFIARSTHQLLFVQDDGTRVEIPNRWGPDLAALMGIHVTKAADLVAQVISKPDPARPGVRIPNVAGIGALATDLLNWSREGRASAEERLGE
jgi:hypothetical protein